MPTPDHTSDYPKPTVQAKSMTRNGRALYWICKLFARLDLPESFDPPKGRPILFAGNHRSFFDIMVTYAIFARLGLSSNILVRADLFDKPGIGWWLRRTGCIPMSKKVREEAEAEAIRVLNAGHTVSIMPEGRLVPPSERPSGVSPGRPGVSRIARSTNAWLVPVMFHGTDKVWPRGTPMPIPRLRRPLVTLRLGEPIDLQSDDHIANTTQIMDAIRDMLKLTDERLAVSES